MSGQNINDIKEKRLLTLFGFLKRGTFRVRAHIRRHGSPADSGEGA